MVEIHLFKHSTTWRTLAPGEVLFREGDPGDVMYGVIDGHIELTCGDRVIDDIGGSSIVGEMALVEAGPRHATAIAKVESRVVPVDQRQFMFLVQEHPTFALNVMKLMAERIRRGNLGGVTQPAAPPTN